MKPTPSLTRNLQGLPPEQLFATFATYSQPLRGLSVKLFGIHEWPDHIESDFRPSTLWHTNGGLDKPLKGSIQRTKETNVPSMSDSYLIPDSDALRLGGSAGEDLADTLMGDAQEFSDVAQGQPFGSQFLGCPSGLSEGLAGLFARLSGISAAQASRVLPDLVSLGIVERREAPPSALFRLVSDHVIADALVLVARARDRVIERMKIVAANLPVPPLSVIVFGSFAHGEADDESDIDTVLVRPEGIDESGQDWSTSVEQWKDSVTRMSGNRVEVIEVAAADIADRLGSRRQVWKDIRADGIAVYGLSLEELAGSDDG